MELVCARIGQRSSPTSNVCFQTNFASLLSSQLGIFSNVGDDTVLAMSHSINDFILSCHFDGEPCDMERDWQPFLHPSFFACYTYTAAASKNAKDIGPDGGLSLVLYLEAYTPDATVSQILYNSFSNIENADGARVAIHQAGSMPTPSSSGVDVTPGHSTSIGLRQTDVRKLSAPYGNCTNRKRLQELDQYSYSAESCLDLCRTGFVYAYCDCLFYTSPIPQDMSSDRSWGCLYARSEDDIVRVVAPRFDCVTSAMHEFTALDDVQRVCGCHEACSYSTYETMISQSTWPGYTFLESTYETFVAGNAELTAYQLLNNRIQQATAAEDYNTLDTLIRRNFLRLNVYMETQNVVRRKESATTTLAGLFANVGGTIGLWAGLSVITVVEVVFFAGTLMTNCVSRCKRKNSVAASKVCHTQELKRPAQSAATVF